jgi:hypothetical protein
LKSINAFNLSTLLTAFEDVQQRCDELQSSNRMFVATREILPQVRFAYLY